MENNKTTKKTMDNTGTIQENTIEQREPHYIWKCELSVEDGCTLFTQCHVIHAKIQVIS